MHILTIVGARPQFIKAAPVCFALRDAGIRETLVHTGQHYDTQMSDIFFVEMGIPRPHHNLGVGSGSHAAQTAKMLSGIEELLIKKTPDQVLVYGDTNSTLAGALAACKLHIPVAHIEAGLRSYNKTMPEEHNRILTDHCATYLFCPTEKAVQNLAKEGIREGVCLVGDTMYDAVLMFSEKAERWSTVLDRLSLQSKAYYLATVHRPYNTDNECSMKILIEAFGQMESVVVFPVHPRTRARMADFRLALPSNLLVTDPVGYLDMLVLQRHARVVLTDSGGIQKEACFVGTPCVTLRSETEWVETVQSGWNILAWGSAESIVHAMAQQKSGGERLPLRAYGDGCAAQKIVSSIRGGETQ